MLQISINIENDNKTSIVNYEVQESEIQSMKKDIWENKLVYL